MPGNVVSLILTTFWI